MKKLLSLFVLLVAIVIGAKAETYKVTYNGEEVSNPTGYFTHDTDGKFGFNTKFNGCTYDGVTYTSGLKLESTTKITFTTDATATITIVQSTWSDKGIKFDDTELATSAAASITGGRVYTIENVAAGDHTVTRSGSESGLFAITVETVASDVPKITASNASVTATESGVAATVEVPVTGANLTGSTLTATLSGAPTGMSVALDQSAISAGAISATATVSYTATENAKGTATLTFSDGTTTKDVTITYVAKVVATELQTTSEARTWDFSKDVTYNGEGEYKLVDDDANTEFVYTDLDLTFADNFDSDAISFKGQYPFRSSSKKYAQAGTLHIKTSVPGTIKVKFSDTGSSKADDAVKRYLQINGENTEYWTSRGTKSDETIIQTLNVETGEIAVAAGDIYLSGSSAIIYSYVTFTPAAVPTTETITIPSDGVLTYVTQNALDFSTINGAFKAYVPTGVNAKKTSVITEEVTAVPAGTALLLKGAAGTYDVEIVADAEAPAENIFLISDGNVQGADNVFAYSKSALKFKKVADTVTIPEGKCYLTIAGVSGDALDLDFDGEATAVDAIAEADEAEAAPVKVIKNGKLYIGNFNVAGQQVK